MMMTQFVNYSAYIINVINTIKLQINLHLEKNLFSLEKKQLKY